MTDATTTNRMKHQWTTKTEGERQIQCCLINGEWYTRDRMFSFTGGEVEAREFYGKYPCGNLVYETFDSGLCMPLRPIHVIPGTILPDEAELDQLLERFTRHVAACDHTEVVLDTDRVINALRSRAGDVLRQPGLLMHDTHLEEPFHREDCRACVILKALEAI